MQKINAALGIGKASSEDILEHKLMIEMLSASFLKSLKKYDDEGMT